jgi:hypothetical protein
MANPWFGSDVAARTNLATLREAVVQRPVIASKMSTALLTPLAAAQRISTRLQHLKARLLPRNTCPPTPTSHHLAISTTQNRISHAPLPPANMANPWFGSDVAANLDLDMLREAVVQSPVIALKMSTAFVLKPPVHAQRISTRLQHLKARLLPRNTCPPTPTSHHLAISKNQNRISHAPLPPANMANPWFGSDVAARSPLATLREAVVQSPVIALKMSTTLLELLVPAQRISTRLQHLKARLLPRNTCPPTPTSHHLAMSKTQNIISHIPRPPANMANPWFGSDVAARAPLATLREAVVQSPVIALKMSTTL